MGDETTHIVDWLEREYATDWSHLVQTLHGVELRVEALDPLWSVTRKGVALLVAAPDEEGGSLEFYVNAVMVGCRDSDFTKERSRMRNIVDNVAEMLEALGLYYHKPCICG